MPTTVTSAGIHDDETSSYRGRPVGAATDYCRGPKVKLFVTDDPTPCQSVGENDVDMWFGEAIGGRDRAVMACQTCPFRGRCSYNAVAARATHGIWGGIELPGDRAQRLIPVYQRLLAQFEDRRHAEIGSAPVVELSAEDHFLRRRSTAA
ncbi:MAG: WhiB family transcriptional regulator, redox-sensing transcriptional regulator [Actinomycetota bacterium]|nr:WhiB family transcriptional regulator, redox-sensing transcriptional regulator [Actinomycetota bacterium]